MKDQDGGFLWHFFFSELVGTALLVLVGLSWVAIMKTVGRYQHNLEASRG